MNLTDQNSAILSLNQALIPGADLIDGRSERDQLGFLSEYASLINFYDSDNKLNGNWKPFLLKDPVFLVASISRTDFKKLHARYLTICKEIKRSFNSEIRSISSGRIFNQLFDQIISVFMQLERWAYYMQRSGEEYNLKHFLLSQVQSRYSNYLWAVLSLREQLGLTDLIKRIEPVKYYLFETYDAIIWKQNRNKIPFWEVLNLKNPLNENTSSDFFNALSRIGDEVYSFLHVIIQNSVSEFEKLNTVKSRYPDTTLLRACVNLLKVHRGQLNGISAKHLDFYYKDILKQTKKDAVADNVFVCAEPAKKNATFLLPAQTMLNGGVDSEKNPVIFSTSKNTSLNPATISLAYTLSVLSDDADTSSLFLTTISNPGVIKKNESGKVQGWETFGATSGLNLTKQKLGFAFASPLLFLREGNRSIHITLNYSGEFSIEMFNSMRFYLSTKSTWLDVTKFVKQAADQISDPLVFTITLDSTQPPIEKFLVNPDAIESFWPMLKIESDTFSNPAEPPSISGLEIEVTVSDVKTFQLSNDHGALSAKAPFQVFGPTPLSGSNFFFGSNEIFSKPVNSLFIQIEWDKLPGDFNTYYQQYNEYIANPVIPVVPKKAGIIKQIIGYVEKIVKAIAAVIHFFRRKKKVPYSDVVPDPFNNICFSVDFNLLQNHCWKKLSLSKDKLITVDPSDSTKSTVIPYLKDPGCSLLKSGKGTQLFNTDGKDCQLQPASFFSYPAPQNQPKSESSATSVANNAAESATAHIDISGFANPLDADPEIQNSTLVYNETSSSGFINIVLNDPEYGFGSGIYPKVVSNVALKNAALISAQPHDKNAKLSLPPNIPFAPKIKSLTVNQYVASQKYNFSYAKEGYPVQCYHYTPFSNYLVYDNTKDQDEYWTRIGAPVTGKRRLSSGLSMFSHFEYNGALLLGLDDLIFPCELNFYFELSRANGQTNQNKKICSYYLSNDYWQPMQILSDGTNNLTCPGIITVQINDDISKNHFSMPTNKYWLAFCTSDFQGDFSHTVFLKTNGIACQRSGNFYLSDGTAPQLTAGSITKPLAAIPQIASIVQPFPSFGGKAAENGIEMNQRISTHLKTKDRVVSSEDIFRLVRQNFDSIFYSKTVIQKSETGKTTTRVYVVKGFQNSNEAGSFLPLVSECEESKIQSFLTERASAFSNILVSNFNLEYVQISAAITVMNGFEINGIVKQVVHALNIFLSPWILDKGTQVKIDQQISAAQVSSFIKSIVGVDTVNKIQFQIWSIISGAKILKSAGSESITPGDGILFVPALNHNIYFDSAK